MKEDNMLPEFVILILVTIFGIVAGVSIGNKVQHDEAIKAGVAYYNPTNAVFTWKTNLVEIGE